MKALLNISRSFWISTNLLLTICPLMGQIKKAGSVPQEDYKKWSTLRITDLSNNTKWTAYSLSYETGEDTTFLKNTEGKIKTAIPNIKNGLFLKNNSFACLMTNNRFLFYDLEINRKVYVDSITDFQTGSNHIILRKKNADSSTSVLIYDLNGTLLKEIEDIDFYSLSPNGNKLACSQHSDRSYLKILDLGKKITLTKLSVSAQIHYKIIKWHNKGKGVLFVGCPAKFKNTNFSELILYKTAEKKIYHYNIGSDKNFGKKNFIEGRYLNNLCVSEDLSSVFFIVKEIRDPEPEKDIDAIQVWNAEDKDLFPRRKAHGYNNEDFHLIQWTPETGRTKRIGNKENPRVILNGNQKFALVYDPEKNKPSFKQKPDLDFSILDIQSGEISPFLHGQPNTGLTKTMSFSPNGQFIVYFKDGNWWLYSFETKSNINLTKSIQSSFAITKTQYGISTFPYGFAGWTQNDKSLLLYDEFDLWEFSTSSFEVKRITHGREENKIYRLANYRSEDFSILDFKAHTLVPGHNFILSVKANDNSKSGISFIDKIRKLQSVFYDSAYVSGVKKSGNENNFIYLQEKFNIPPKLILKTQNKNPYIIFESNPHHKNYTWGHSQLITYKNSKGILLNGTLFFPAGFDTEKTYPMIVNIYEKQTFRLHKYMNPTLLNGSSFNISNYTNNGYFVLLPDISYELGNPGYSALDCVTSAVEKVLREFPVNQKKIGLIGHSFGGYETNFIITQSKLFSAAISGAGLSDLNSGYLSFNQNDYLPETWRYESFQMRMGSTLFENYEGFQTNSPISSAANVFTPLLSYTGDKDTSVDPAQSKELHLALRRLKRKHILLIYPNEDHVFTNKKNQIDLTSKSSEWFEYYLKDGPKLKWMEAQ
ncbi:alpha/beta hydrolase family protein [Flavobacterium sp. FlaQc-48]|uniref:alpha/beta hydrolase family protein n=1 Tax=Flavobacterium sp. FlaQc-48 TaxID=3374181 RepID=UPI003757B8D0